MSEQSAEQRILDCDVVTDSEWQMHIGERFTLEGILRTLKPRLSVEVGRAEGGSLRRIAAHSHHVHSFDLVPEPGGLRESLQNVVFHTGDAAVLLPEALKSLGEAGHELDFALVDGDHTSEGVRRDAEALLAADCCRNTVIVFHDTANDDVRAGLESVRFVEHPKVALSMLDLVPGFLVKKGPYSMQIWNGLGLVVLAEDRADIVPITEPWRYSAALVNRVARDAMRAAEPQSKREASVALVGAVSAAVGAGAAWFAASLRGRS